MIAKEHSRDFVIKRLAQDTKGHPFAHSVAHLLTAMGYRTRVSPEGPDGGVDIVAHKDESEYKGLLPLRRVYVPAVEDGGD